MKLSFKVFYSIGLFLIYCIDNTPRGPFILSIVDSTLNHTHEIRITYEDLKSDKTHFNTTETLGHYHLIILNLEEKEKLKAGISIQKETELSAGHKHTLTLQIINY